MLVVRLVCISLRLQLVSVLCVDLSLLSAAPERPDIGSRHTRRSLLANRLTSRSRSLLNFLSEQLLPPLAFTRPPSRHITHTHDTHIPTPSHDSGHVDAHPHERTRRRQRPPALERTPPNRRSVAAQGARCHQIVRRTNSAQSR